MFWGSTDVDEAAFLLFVGAVLKTFAIEMGAQGAVVSNACVSVDSVAAGNAACAQVEVLSGGEIIVAVLLVGLKVLDDGSQCIGGGCCRACWG